MMPMLPAKAVSRVRAFLVRRLLKLRASEVSHDMDERPMFLWMGGASFVSSGSKGRVSSVIAPSRRRTMRLAYCSASSGLCVTMTTRRSFATSFSSSMTWMLVGGALVELVPEAHLPQRLGGTAAALSARYARDGQGQLDVGEDGLVGDEVIALEHETDGVVAVGVPVPVGVAAGGDAVDDELAAVVAVEAADDVEQRGLARAAGAEDGDKFAVAQVEADPVERCLCQIAGGVFLFDIDKLKHWPAFPAAERGSVCWPIPPGICGRRGKHSICLILSEEYEQFMS